MKRQLIIGYIAFSIFILSGSIQIIFSPFSFVRVINLLVVIFCSAAIGAFIREWFVLKEKNKEKK